MNQQSRIAAVVPFSLRDAPSFIEKQLPVGRISAEAYKERKAGAGQTLTALGSYWKGRKPLILVRATILGCLLPASNDKLADLRIFLLLMGMDDATFARRLKTFSPKKIDAAWDRHGELVDPNTGSWRRDITHERRVSVITDWLSSLSYDDRLDFCHRAEELDDDALLDGAWDEVNAHLGTSAASMPELIEQLGIMRFGRRPSLADTFCGGGSIPFEAARMGCDVYASDLNPIACMLTWGAFNIIGANENARIAGEAEQARIIAHLENDMTTLGLEHDAEGNRAKVFLYCLETKCPKTGWMVPVSSSWIISKTKRVIAVLVPDATQKRYDIEVRNNADDVEMKEAEKGTVRDGCLVHPMNPDRGGVSLAVVRGDFRDGEGNRRNRLRQWEKNDFFPRKTDIWQERLYCIQWVPADGIAKRRPETFYAAVTAEDLARDANVHAMVAANLDAWQRAGLVPDSRIEPGEKTDEPIRTRGWTYWHHLFSPRQLLILAKLRAATQSTQSVQIPKALDRMSKLCRWSPGGPGKPGVAANGAMVGQVFDNQAMNTMINYAERSSFELFAYLNRYEGRNFAINAHAEVRNSPVGGHSRDCDLYVTDPPYADAVNYHEITEYFIAWLRTAPPPPFAAWHWDSQRNVAIKGSDEKFRTDMVTAYRAMAAHMPDNGIQVVMFTHQDAGVWADLASIMWAAGLRVSAAWNIVTETSSALKQGNYVQGTILLVLRKRIGSGNAKRMDIEGEIEDAVDAQIATMNDLANDWTTERLYTDGDMQLAAYASALRVITNYETIDRVQVGADVYRKLKKGERTIIRDLIDYAASVANNKLVPDGFQLGMWRDLDKTSRFYIRMLDMEAKGSTKFADYQDFAKTFSVADYTDLMAETRANKAALAGAAALKGRNLSGNEFGSQPLRRVLFAIFKTMQKGEPKDGVSFLRIEYGSDYWLMRTKLIEFARYVSVKTASTRPDESAAADLLSQKLEVDRL